MKVLEILNNLFAGNDKYVYVKCFFILLIANEV
jgi:hypothetical protein